MKRLLIPLLLLLGGCATMDAHRMTELSIGMTKAQVTEILGAPMTVSAKEEVEFYNYQLICRRWEPGYGWCPTFVEFKEGKVIAYGNRGDFGTTEHTADRVKVDINK